MTDASYTPQVSSQDPAPIEGGPLPPAAPAPLLVPDADPGRVDSESPHYAASQGLALREVFEDAQLTDRLLGFIGADQDRRFDAHRRAVFGEEAPALLSPEEANERYGVPGRLTFDAPVDRNIAAWRQSQAQRSAYRDEVVANADLEWWQTLGTGFAGAVLDPLGLPLWLAPELKAGQLATALTRTAPVLRSAGPIGRGAFRGAFEGAAGGVAYEGVNLWLHHEARDDYDFGQASFNVLTGTLLGGAFGTAGGWWESRGARPRPPAAVEALDDDARLAGFVEAFDALIDDRPVDVGPVLRQAEVARTSGRVDPERLATLNETGEAAAIAGRRLDEAVAVTPRGDELPVRYVLVEAEDLVTSHDDDLYPNDLYPRELQPRRRDRAGAQARNRQLEAELNPKRLMTDVGAETGAPIIAADGTVESGNGRTIALRRSYRTGSEASKRYRAELEARGYDVEGMQAPVLVRERTGRLTGEERVKLTRDMNAEATEAYSPSERAAADAQAIDDDLLGMIEGADLNAASNRRFVKGFLDRVASDDLNRMTTADGRLSDAGLDRMNAALVAKAYGDRALVEALFEATDSNIKAIGAALANAAPEWAAMRAAVARGEVPAELDPTEALKAAVAFVRHVRARRGNIEEAMELTIGQFDAFDGAAMTPETEAFVRSFFRTSKEGATLWKSPRGAASLAEGLRWLAGETRKVQPGPNLFGETADAATGRQLLDAFGRWFAKQGDEGSPVADLFAPDDAGGNVRAPVVEAGREPGGSGAGGEAAEGLTFKTAKGSSYRLEANGQTTRDKAFRPEHGEAEQGPQPTSERTYYVEKSALDPLALFQAKGGPRMVLVDDGAGSLGLRYDSGADAGKMIAGTVVPFHDQPAVGLYPVEVWKGGSRVHFGNEIVEVGQAKPRVPLGQTPPPPKGEPFADPDVAALAADTDAIMAREGLTPESLTGEGEDPQALADAIAAGAACLKGA